MNRVLIRIVGAPLLLAGLALAVYADHARQTTSAVTVLIACFAAISFHELCAMARLKGLQPPEDAGLAAILLSFLIVLGIVALKPVLVPIMLLLAILVSLVLCPRRYTPVDAGFGYLAFGYVSLLLFIPFGPDTGGREWIYWLLFLVATNKGSDMAAYVVGKAIGRHKLAPAVSPNKTWEGSIAGLIAGSILGFVVLRWWRAQVGPASFEAMSEMEDVGLLIAASAAVTVAAQLGDLVKSAIKRWAGVKDSGRLLPEFGGALDMVDSFILSAPVAAWFLRN